jgi:hypothetical protein
MAKFSKSKVQLLGFEEINTEVQKNYKGFRV